MRSSIGLDRRRPKLGAAVEDVQADGALLRVTQTPTKGAKIWPLKRANVGSPY
jgi:hypothetical protein